MTVRLTSKRSVNSFSDKYLSPGFQLLEAISCFIRFTAISTNVSRFIVAPHFIFKFQQYLDVLSKMCHFQISYRHAFMWICIKEENLGNPSKQKDCCTSYICSTSYVFFHVVYIDFSF